MSYYEEEAENINSNESPDQNVKSKRLQTFDNPIPNFIDFITGDCVEKPAISPYGHVLSYDTWIKIFKSSGHKNLCPFTLQKLTRRDLTKLTMDNYYLHRRQ